MSNIHPCFIRFEKLEKNFKKKSAWGLHTHMGYAKAPWGACFLHSPKPAALTLHQTYAKLTPNLRQQSLQTLHQTYTNLTPTLQLYAYTVLYKLLCETLHQTYAKLTRNLRQQVLRLSEYCYTLLQNLHETYGSQTLTKS
jgi:hypothetical protein